MAHEKIIEKEIEERICKDYSLNQFSIRGLSKKFNLCTAKIKKILNKNNITLKGNKISKYSLNENFFEIIDSKEKAYILGFLYADGYLLNESRPGRRVSKKNNTRIGM